MTHEKFNISVINGREKVCHSNNNGKGGQVQYSKLELDLFVIEIDKVDVFVKLDLQIRRKHVN